MLRGSKVHGLAQLKVRASRKLRVCEKSFPSLSEGPFAKINQNKANRICLRK